MADDFRTQVERLRPYLLRYAAMQLRSPEAAEDAVQEALVAALVGEASFGGRSNLRTWLTGILKHKIVDAVRRQARETPLAGEDPESTLEDLDAFFARDGRHWQDRPLPWDNPDGALEQKQFLAALEQCLQGLPVRTARVFMMREHLGMDTKEICQELKLTPTHCWVMLYRARMALRQCLELNWFGKT